MYVGRDSGLLFWTLHARALSIVPRPALDAYYRGDRRYCPLCERSVRTFLTFGDPPRRDVRCPICGSFERHRLDWLFLTRNTNLLDGTPKRLLHIAPERCVARMFRQVDQLDYLSADLTKRKAMVRMDITDIHYPDNSFSAIYCSHVLEHVPADRKAMSEFFRVLKPGGWALLQVPITDEKTFEDPRVTDPRERKRQFGQWDHVRRCGPDYVDRLRDAGFNAKTVRASDFLDAADAERMRIGDNELIFFCTKP